MEPINRENPFIAAYKLRWSKKEDWKPGDIYSQLEKIYHKDSAYLAMCIEDAMQYDMVGVALCAYTCLSWEEDKDIIQLLQSRTEQRMEEALVRSKELLKYQQEENLRIEETAALEKNGKLANEVRKTLRAKLWKEMQEKKRENLQELSNVWNIFLLIWQPENKEEVEQLLMKLVEGYLEGTEKLHRKVRKTLVEDLCDALILSLDIGEFPDNDAYIRGMYILQKVLTPIEQEAEEVHFGKRLEMDRIDDFTKILLNTYIETLFKKERYRTMSSFLHKTIRNDYMDLYGVSEEEFWDRLVRESQSDRLAECRFRLSGEMDSLDGIERWYQWITQRVTSEICLGWCQWERYCFKLEILLDTEIETEEEFQRIARENMPPLNYPFDETQNLKRVVASAIHIYGELWKRQWDAMYLVDLWGENNFFAYSRRKTFIKSPEDWENSKKPHDWQLNCEHFFAYPREAEEKVRLYMNSPMRFFWEFREFVIRIAQEYSTSRVGELFHEYELEGILRKVDFQTSARGRMKFELNPRYVKNSILWDSDIPKTRVFFNQLVHNHEDYYREHEDELRTLSIRSICTFRLCGYAKNGANDGILLVDDIQGGIHRTDIVPEEEMNKILDWMREMQESGTFITKEKPGFRFVYDPDDLGMTQEFAEEIFKTFLALRKEKGAVRRFLGYINQGKMDKISKFQYLPDRTFVESFTVKDFKKFRTEFLIPNGNALCYDENLSNMERCNIYMNTCMKSFFSLAEFWNKGKITAEDMISFKHFNCEYNYFLFLVDFVKNQDGNSVFRLNHKVKIREGIHGENYRWICKGVELPADKVGFLYRVTIKDVDSANKIVWIKDIHPMAFKDSWSVYIRNLLDLKNDFSVPHVENIKKKARSIPVEFFENRRVVQLCTQYNQHFSLVGKKEYSKEYNLFWCRNILTVLGEKNPFKEKERFYKEQPPENYEIQTMRDGFADFMKVQFECLKEDANAFLVEELMDFFYNSPYYLFVEEKEFMDILVEHFELSEAELRARYEDYKKQVVI